MQAEVPVSQLELFNEPGETHALMDIECERVEVELLPPTDQSIRLGRWLVAAGEAALGD
jgi:hypothetical protein